MRLTDVTLGTLPYAMDLRFEVSTQVVSVTGNYPWVFWKSELTWG